jgi:hypothetical protein
MSIASRLEKLERRKPARKVPRNDEDLAAWALDRLFPSTPRGDEPVHVDSEPSPYLVFLRLVKSGEIAREMERRGLKLDEDEPAPVDRARRWREETVPMNGRRW